MSEFWLTLSGLIEKYTVADTAYVISIISGIATVVAAVGAIIAVIVTRSIAKEQIEIAKQQNVLSLDQNKISAMQIEITQQQNKIGLFKERNDVYEYIYSFLFSWSTILENSDSEITSELASQVWNTVMRFRIDADPELSSIVDESNSGEMRSVFSIVIRKDILYFNKTKKLFRLRKKDFEFIDKVQLSASSFMMYANKPENPDETDESVLVDFAKNFYSLLKHNRDGFLRELESQIQLGEY